MDRRRRTAVSGSRHRIRVARNLPSAEVLATRRQPQRFRSVRAKSQHPVAQPPCIKQFARLGDAVGGFRIGIARIFLVEAAERGFQSFGIGWFKWLWHRGVLSDARRLRKVVSLPSVFFRACLKIQILVGAEVTRLKFRLGKRGIFEPNEPPYVGSCNFSDTLLATFRIVICQSSEVKTAGGDED